jgi:3-keto-5-aminohexanoate cleavage enzyme
VIDAVGKAHRRDSTEESEMKTDLISPDKVIITVAITGGLHGREANPNLPLSAEEQAQAAYDAYNAGASIVHLHVRDDQGVCTPELKYYDKAIHLIRERCPIITQVGNGIGTRVLPDGRIGPQITQEERLNLLNVNVRPDMMTLNCGSFEFRSPVSTSLFDNSEEFNIEFIDGCREKGYGLELEVYDPSHIANVVSLAERGILEGQLHFSIVLGIHGGAPATCNNLLHMVGEVPEGSSWQLVAVGKYHFRSNAIALATGGNVRTGMEDCVSMRPGEPVESNAQLVERTAEMARAMGREPTSVEEARIALGL